MPEPLQRRSIPLHHLPLFWIGLLPVVMLLWAWADSMRHQTLWTYRPSASRSCTVTLYQSSLHFNNYTVTLLPDASPVSAGASAKYGPVIAWRNSGYRFQWQRRPVTDTGSPWFPGYVRDPHGFEFFGRSYDTDIHQIPFWMLLLPILLLWLPATWWQARRRRAKLRAAEAEQARLMAETAERVSDSI